VDIAALLLEFFGRIPPLAHRAVDGLDAATLHTPPREGANPIDWLVWHMARGQDVQIAELMDADQLWVTGDWARRFGLDPDPDNSGYGHTAAEIAAVRPDGPDVLIDYLEAVDARTRSFLETLDEADLDRVVDERWSPPVTLGVRLVSIADDCVQHAGQAAYVRGLLEG
jgi:hypothetical protein